MTQHLHVDINTFASNFVFISLTRQIFKWHLPLDTTYNSYSVHEIVYPSAVSPWSSSAPGHCRTGRRSSPLLWVRGLSAGFPFCPGGQWDHCEDRMQRCSEVFWQATSDRSTCQIMWEVIKKKEKKRRKENHVSCPLAPSNHMTSRNTWTPHCNERRSRPSVFHLIANVLNRHGRQTVEEEKG